MTRLLNTKENRVFPGVDKKLFQYGPEVTLPLSVLKQTLRVSIFHLQSKVGVDKTKGVRQDFVNSLFSPPSFDPLGNN